MFPDGHPQERFLNVAYFANRYGLSLAGQLDRELPHDVARHHLLVL
jgi:hypothetical protein